MDRRCVATAIVIVLAGGIVGPVARAAPLDTAAIARSQAKRDISFAPDAQTPTSIRSAGTTPGEPPLAAAIFLHRHPYTVAGTPKPTSGCVSLAGDHLELALRMIDPARRALRRWRVVVALPVGLKSLNRQET